MENCPLPKCLSSKIGKGKVQPDRQIGDVSTKKKTAVKIIRRRK